MESMEENQGLKLVDDTSRSTNIPNNDEKTNNDDDNNKHGTEDNNKLEDTQIKTNEEESIAFKLQFDEILIATKLLENAKSNNNNRYYNAYAKTNSLSSLNNKRISEIENSYFTHQKSYSYQPSLKYHNYHNQAKHKRNNSSVPKLNLNGISNNSYYPTTTNRNVKLNSLSSTPYVGYDVFDELSFDDAFGLKSSLKEFDYKFNNNNRHDSDWDSLPNGQGYPPLTPSSIHSSSSSFSPSLSPYYPSTKSSYHQHHHWFLDDKEFFAQQLLLEEERKLLEIQQIQLNDAIAAHQLRLKSEANNNNNNFDPLFKFNLVQTPTTSLTPLTPLTPSTPSALNNNNSRYKPNSFLHHKSSSSSSQSLNHLSSPSSSSSPLSPSSPSSQSRYYKEPIGTPVRKPSPSNSNNNQKHNVKPISISTASSSSSSLLSSSSSSSLSPSSSSSSFSLFSKSPSSSINTSNININVNLSPTTPPSMPITPPTTPHNNNNNNNNNSYFNPFSSLNILNPKSKNLNNNLNNKHHHNLFYNNSASATIFDEREEDSLSWPDESFNKEFERPLQLNNNNNNNLKFHRGHHRHTSELIKLLV